jgi:hypothetical protein
MMRVAVLTSPADFPRLAWADFITTTSESRFSVHTGFPGATKCRRTNGETPARTSYAADSGGLGAWQKLRKIAPYVLG